jgi:hypothetical protein
MIAGVLTSSFSPAARSVRLYDAEPPRRQCIMRRWTTNSKPVTRGKTSLRNFKETSAV